MFQVTINKHNKKYKCFGHKKYHNSKQKLDNKKEKVKTKCVSENTASGSSYEIIYMTIRHEGNGQSNMVTKIHYCLFVKDTYRYEVSTFNCSKITAKYRSKVNVKIMSLLDLKSLCEPTLGSNEDNCYINEWDEFP